MTLISDLSTGSYVVTRKARGTYQDGYYIAGSDETVTIGGSMQPTTAQELKIEEEGVRLRQYYKFFSDQPILAVNTVCLNDADHVFVDSKRYRVLGVEHWRGLSLSHYMSTLVLEPEQ